MTEEFTQMEFEEAGDEQLASDKNCECSCDSCEGVDPIPEMLRLAQKHFEEQQRQAERRANLKFERYVRQRNIEHEFAYHEPVGDQPKKYAHLRMLTRHLAREFVAVCPQSHELDIALDKLNEAVMWANASIARWSHGG